MRNIKHIDFEFLGVNVKLSKIIRLHSLYITPLSIMNQIFPRYSNKLGPIPYNIPELFPDSNGVWSDIRFWNHNKSV